MTLGRPALVAALLCLTACASGGGFLARSSTPPDELAALKQRVLELQRQVTVNEIELARLRERVAALESGSAPSAARRGERAADAASRQATAEPPAESRSRPSAPPERPRASDLPEVEVQELEPVSVPVDRRPPPPRVAAGEEPAAERLPAVESAPSAAEPSDDARVPITPEAQSLYDEGYSLFHQGRFVDAEAAFTRYLDRYPNTSLADNAGFWIGESRYARGDFEGAIAIFEETIARFPDGNKVPDALLKTGYALVELGDIEAAREVFGEVVRRYSGSAAAARAEERSSSLP